MQYSKYLAALVGKQIWITDSDDQPWITLRLDDDEGDRGEIVEVGDDFCVLRYKRRLRKDIVRVVPLSMVTLIAEA